MTIDEAFAYCEKITKSHYENFPVGSFFIPHDKRRHFYSIYAFSRIADDFADEASFDGHRMEKLDAWWDQLERCYAGHPEHPVFMALAETAHRYDLPQTLFQDLIIAFKMDVTKQTYADFAEVLHYCRHSANPVGRLVLMLFDYRDDHLFELSDNICTALQLANFWQDVAVDLKKDRVYIPQAELKSFGYSMDQLHRQVYNENFRRLMTYQVDRTWVLFEKGCSLPHLVHKNLRIELRLVWLGGTRILQKIEADNYNCFSRPKLGKWDVIRMLWQAFMKQPRPGAGARQY